MIKTGWDLFDRQMNPPKSVLEAEEVLHSMRRYYEARLRRTMDQTILIPHSPGDKIICLPNNEAFLVLEESDFVIDRVYIGMSTFKIVNPICFRTAIGIHYSNLYSWSLDIYPRYGFHLLSNGLCLGDIKIKTHQSREYYIQLIPTLKEMWRGINLNSLGSVIGLPPGVDQRWASVNNGIEYLLREGLVTRVNATEDPVPQHTTEEEEV